jgi:dienelactone hydrolase
MLLARKFRHLQITGACLVLSTLLGLPAPVTSQARSAVEATAFNASTDLTTQDITFTGHGGLPMRGTVIAPTGGEGRRPGLVLIGGSGPGPRTLLLPEARAFARLGLVILVYDKRTSGYDQTQRDYDTLAADAKAAFETLRRQPGVDPKRVGVWGESEGGWIAPLVASRSPDVAFVITVGAVGMAPARQTAWFYENLLRHLGVSGSMLRFPRTAIRFAIGAGWFPEANYDPLPVLRRVHQPMLLLWSAEDFSHPPQESSQMMRQALNQGGNTHYTIRFLPNSAPNLHHTTKGGWDRRSDLAPGYPELVASWVDRLAAGPPPATAQAPPRQDRQSRPLAPLGWYESVWLQAAALALFLIAFAGYPAVAVIRRLRHRAGPPALRRPTRWLAISGLAATLGFVSYYVFFVITGGQLLGPIILGRPIPWLLLQVLAMATAVTGVITALAWWQSRQRIEPGRSMRLGLLLTAAAVFVPWAIYWGLLVP